MTRPAGGKPHYRLHVHADERGELWWVAKFKLWPIGKGHGWKLLGVGESADSSAEAIRMAPR